MERNEKREATMNELAVYGTALIRKFGRRDDIIVTYHRPTEKTISAYTDFQRRYHGIVTGCEYFFFWVVDENGNHLLYVKDVSADAPLTAMYELMDLASRKF